VPRASAGKPLSPLGLRVAQPRTTEGRSVSGVAERSESEDGLCCGGARLLAEAFGEGGPCAASFGWQATFAPRATRGAATHDRRAKRVRRSRAK
jgi:hypothetical protein